MDVNTAISIVKNCTVDNKITKPLLQSTPNFILITKNNPNNLNLQTISGVTKIYPNINFLEYDYQLDKSLFDTSISYQNITSD